MITIPATIESISTRKDRTVSLRIGTQELAPDTAGQLLGLQNKLAYVAINAAEFQPSEVEMLLKANDDLTDMGKSSSERLRNTFYVLWKQEDKGFKDFTDYYRHRMENIINLLKTQIK